MSLRRSCHHLAAGTALIVLFSGSAGAQELSEQSPVALGTVIIQGATDASSPAGTATTTTTTRAEIERRQIDSIEDLGRRQEAGVTFNRSSRTINIRGLEGPRVLTTIDGIRVPYLADATRGASGGADSFDFNALSAADLTRGADPMLGSGALGGVLALRTLEPGDLLGGRPVGAFIKSGYDSADESWFTTGAAAARAGATSVLLQGGYRKGHETETRGDNDGIGTIRTEANPEDYDQYNLLGKVYHDIEGGHRIGLVGELFKRSEDVDVQTQSARGNFRAGSYFTGEEVKRERIGLTYDYEAPERGAGLIDEASARLYWQSLERLSTTDAYRFTSVIGPYGRAADIQEETFGFNGHAARDWNWGQSDNRLIFGTELRTSQTTQYSAGYDNCDRPRGFGDIMACNFLHTNQADTPKVDGSSVGFFVENEVGLYDGRLRVTPGLRFDWYEEKPKLTPEYESNADFDGTLPPSSSDSAWSPKVLVEYDLLPELTAYGQWTQGFRAPTVGELYSRFGAPGTYLRAGNPYLDPETSNGFDIGLKLERETFGAFINLFHTDYKNFIDTVQLAPPGGEYPLGGISSYYNIPDARISGVELGGHVDFADYWTARAHIAYTEGRNRTDDTWLNSVSPLTAILGLAYNREHWGAEISSKLASRRDRVDGTGFVAPGYGIADITAWYEPKQLPGLKVAGGVFNLFDREYYDAVSVPLARTQPDAYYSEPGRSFKVNVSYKF
ncbi:hemoglobin/transferrin/lactoferrin receptor protein [Aureimonas altamirensis DSM 21988]|uniref:TonB-dependent hemoglobin/transferrin/lactoferrin family receptor n=2 Tax=Aureimonas altamirensis TaxID=370622 RepID=A0A0P0YWM4_9HYPH|nr:TonB-dependent hemoglobin/transferrin/lactoferrin family receptor [Aureimonas altamirensis]SHI50238.1 hemoglobin/transferrin/lactoferrin receptor protein [Aureimonas altamirensis DSM 21988]